MARNIILTGVPRSGTTLVCHLLNHLPDTVALDEPLTEDFFALSGASGEIRRRLAEFMRETRENLRLKGMAPSVHVQGRVPDNHLSDETGEERLRRQVYQKGMIPFDQALAGDFTLCVKHNASFTAILHELADCYPCFAVIRNPLASLASWQTVDLPVQRGRIPLGERLDHNLAAELAGMEDRLDRQLHILHWFFSRFQQCLPPENILRYEDLVAESSSALARIVPGAVGLRQTLRSRNSNPLYHWETMDAIAARLLASKGAYWDFYSRREVSALKNQQC